MWVDRANVEKLKENRTPRDHLIYNSVLEALDVLEVTKRHAGRLTDTAEVPAGPEAAPKSVSLVPLAVACVTRSLQLRSARGDTFQLRNARRGSV